MAKGLLKSAITPCEKLAPWTPTTGSDPTEPNACLGLAVMIRFRTMPARSSSCPSRGLAFFALALAIPDKTRTAAALIEDELAHYPVRNAM